jgi:hypothetical protein
MHAAKCPKSNIAPTYRVIRGSLTQLTVGKSWTCEKYIMLTKYQEENVSNGCNLLQKYSEINIF